MRKVLRLRLVLLALAAAWPFAAVGAPPEKPDPWAPIRFLAGEWEGTAEGQAGKGTVRRSYAFVLRQFHPEGFVNQFVVQGEPSRAGTIVFDSESFENFSNTWKARETYDVLSNDDFVETFALAPPGGAFETYSKSRFRRVAKR